MKSGERPKTLRRAVRVTLQNYAVAAILTSILLLIFIPSWIQWCLFYVGGFLFMCSVIAPFIDDWRPKARVPIQGKAVFISGCDSGFGHSLAQRLDDLGLHVFAGCLFPEKDGAQTLKKSCSERLHVVQLDVTSEESVKEAVKYVNENLGENKFWALVNNAGLNGGGEIAWTSFGIMKNVMDVNTFGVMRLTKTFVTLLCKDKARVVTVASAAGRYTYPGMVSYCMSKQATVSFTEGLRLEMYRFGVKVITIEPWMYRTPITDKANVLNYIQRAWEESPQEIKDFYPEGYIERYTRGSLKFLSWSMSDKPQEVVDCMEEAVLSLDPKYVYNPGTLFSRLSFWFLYRLPKPIADALIHDECAVRFPK